MLLQEYGMKEHIEWYESQIEKEKARAEKEKARADEAKTKAEEEMVRADKAEEEIILLKKRLMEIEDKK